VAAGHDLESLKDFLKRIGSNLRLSGRALRFAYENPWAILARHRARPKSATSKNGGGGGNRTRVRKSSA